MAEALYYNTFDPDDNYYEIRALAGLVEQSREDNEQQAILRFLVKKLGDTLYKDGSLVSGGDFNTNPANPNQISMSSAKIWFNGIIHDVPAATVNLSGIGTENIGVQIVTSTITFADDSGLLDPAAEAENYGQPGANRTKIVATWQVNSNTGTFVPFYQFKAGIQQTQPKIGEIDPVAITLARRDYDLTGNYVVAGFDMAVDDLNNTQYKLTVGNNNDPTYTGSKAYVRGTEVGKLISETLPLPKALGTRPVLNEQASYITADHTSVAVNENRFALNNQPVKDITQVFASFGVTRVINSHNFNGFDQITEVGETLLAVKAVWKFGSITSPDYTNSVNNAAGPGDYYRSSNGIRWDVTGSTNEPTSGDSYQVYAVVNRPLLTSEYSIYTDGNGVNYLDISAVNPSVSPTVVYSYNESSNTPDTSVLNIFYDFYLSRIDTVCLTVDSLNPNGAVAIQTGSSDVNPVAPSTSGYALALGQILIRAGTGTAAQNVAITPYNVKRLTQLDLNKILSRLQRAEYNQAVADLDDAGLKRAGNSITSLSGILTESFTYSAKDIVFDGRVDSANNPSGASTLKFVRTTSSSPAFTTRNILNITDREIDLPETSTGFDLVPGASAPSPTVGSTTATAYNLSYTCPVKSTYVAASQMNATSGLSITKKPVAGSTPRKPSLVTQTEIMRSLLDNTAIEALDPYNALPVVKTDLGDKAKLSTNPDLLRNFTGFTDGLSVFMAQTWVWVFCQNFSASVYVDVKFDGKPVRLSSNTLVAGAYTLGTIGAGSTASTFTGTATANIFPATSYVITNASGQATFAFEIPAGVSSNTAALTLQSAAGEVCAASFTMDPKVTFQEHSVTTSSSTPITPVDSPVIPKLVSAVAKNNSNATTTNITANTAMHVDVTWDKAGGIPFAIVLVIDPPSAMLDATHRVEVITRDQLSTGQLLNQTWSSTVFTATAAFRYTAYVYDELGLAAPIQAFVTFNGALPSKVDPSVQTVSVATPAAISVATQASASWSGLANATALSIYHSATGRPPVTESDPNTNTTRTVDAVPGFNTVVFVFTSSTGSLVMPYTFNVPLPPGKTGGDELAQIFAVSDSSFITDINVYFSNVPTLSSGDFASVTLDIRDTANGLPVAQLVDGARVTKTYTGTEIVKSSDGNTACNFAFASPVFLDAGKQYAIVLRSDNKDFQIYVANPTENLVGTVTAFSASNGYPNGSIMTSGTNNGWSPVTNSDIKFSVNAATYQNQGLIYFNALNSLSSAVGMRVGLSTKSFILPTVGTSTQSVSSTAWEFSINNTGVWYPFQPEAYFDFPDVATSVAIRATLTTLNDKTSPRLPKLGTSAVILTRGLSGTYMSKAVTLNTAYQFVRMIAQEVTPGSNSTNWYVSDDTTQPGSVAAWSGSTTYASGAFVVSSGINYQSLQSGNLNNTPVSSPTYWRKVNFYGNLVWTQIPSAGQITSPVDGVFVEHDRTIDLGADSGRTKFRFRVDLLAPNAAATLNGPRVRNIITIVTS